MKKVLIVLHAEPGTHDSMGRAFHALLYTKELSDGGLQVKLVFDGGGTKWASEMSNQDNKLNPLFEEVKKLGLIENVCDYCIGAFGADRSSIESAGLPVRGESQGHPSLLKYVNDGYQVITL